MVQIFIQHVKSVQCKSLKKNKNVTYNSKIKINNKR